MLDRLMEPSAGSSSIRFCLLLGIVLLACACRGKREHEFNEASLVTVWRRAPESAEKEPWFGGFLRTAVRGSRILVSDPVRKTVLLLDSTGAFLRTIGREGNGPGEYQRPSAVSITGQGNLIVDPGLIRVLQSYTPEGGFEHRVVLDPAERYQVGSPVAIEDSVFVFTASPVKLKPTREELQDMPLAAVWDHGTWRGLGHRPRRMHESLERQVDAWEADTRLSARWLFSVGSVGWGLSVTGQRLCLFISRSNPYEVLLLDDTAAQTTFTYFDPGTSLGLVAHEDIPQDSYEAFRDRVPMDFFTSYSASTGTRNYVTFSPAPRGFFIQEGILYVYVERLLPNDEIAGDIFAVDLARRRLMTRYALTPIGPMRFAGITGEGLFIFNQIYPVPGLIAMRRTGEVR